LADWEHGASSLVRNAVRAEQAGFEFAAISDHFSPWLEEQGPASGRSLAWLRGKLRVI
jgi:alkanesulfonate monooxygenase SsuD/methylene tetrahydromethanopterin reductase-like flavin-dependent oxidoreductase (luciferase family)